MRCERLSIQPIYSLGLTQFPGSTCQGRLGTADKIHPTRTQWQGFVPMPLHVRALIREWTENCSTSLRTPQTAYL